jgi:hypothetical protein
MGKRQKDSVLDDYEKLKKEIIREKVNEIFRNHPRDYIAKLEEIGFKYFDDDNYYEEKEERNSNGNRKLTHRGNRNLTHPLVDNKFPDVS